MGASGGRNYGHDLLGSVLARLNPGAKLVFEQTEVSPEFWLPKRFY